MADIKAILFDFFGVICTDQYAAWMRQNKHQRTGEYERLSQENDRGKMSMADFFVELSALSGVPAEKIESDFQANTDIDHRVVQLILKLKRHHKIGLLSNASLDWIGPILDESHLRPLFDAIIVSSEVGFIKPQLQIYQVALEKLGTQPAATVFIDDSQINVAAAERLGMISLLYGDRDGFIARLKELSLRI